LRFTTIFAAVPGNDATVISSIIDKQASMNRAIKKYYPYLTLFLVSFFILLQEPFAPFANKVAAYDPGVFIYSAKQMLGGGLIYKDIFDHKGPVLYLANVAGLVLLDGDLTGIWLVDLLALLTAAAFAFKVTVILAGKRNGLLAAVYMLLLLAALEPGDSTQFYALPFICISLYLLVKNMSGNIRFKPRTVVPIAACFTLTLLLQPNLVTLWCGFGIAVLFKLIYEKEYAYLLNITATVIITVALVLSPFLIYAIHNNVLDDAISCYWTFNRTYSHATPASIASGVYYSAINLEKGHAILPIFFYIASIAINFKNLSNKSLHLSIIVSFILTFVLGCGLSGRNYPHYSIILLPLICLMTGYSLDAAERFGVKKWYLILTIAVLSWRLVALQCFYLYSAYKPDQPLNDSVAFIKDNSKPTDYIAVVGNDSQLYYLTGRKSSSIYHYTAPILDNNNRDNGMQKRFIYDLERHRPTLIIIKTADYQTVPNFISGFLSSGYSRLIYQDPSYSFYRSIQ
jgi:hypothetical protein